MKIAYLDIETDLIPATFIKVVGVSHRNDEGTLVYETAHDKHTLHTILDKGMFDVIVGQNIINFDENMLEFLWAFDIRNYCHVVMDTLLMSKLVDFNRFSHSMASYGKDYGLPKGDIDHEDHTDEELVAYLLKDLQLTERMYDDLSSKAQSLNIPMDVFIREMQASEIIKRQSREGVTFDRTSANLLVSELDTEMNKLRASIEPLLGTVDMAPSKIKHPPKKQFKLDGTPSALAVKYFPELAQDADGWFFTKSEIKTYLPHHVPLYTQEQVTMDSTKNLKTWLLDEGWEPTMWNNKKIVDEAGKIEWKRTTPKLYDDNKEPCPNLEKIGFSKAKDVALFLTLRSRRNVIKSENGTGWLNNPRLAIDGKISSEADTLGANTGRFTHKVIANVPRVTSVYGKQLRSLFGPPKGMLQVGWDASKLEGCMEAHYLMPIDPEAAKKLMSGELHDDNAKLFGVTRDKAKEIKYALTYGAKAARLASITGWKSSKARKAYDMFWKANSGLDGLKAKLIRTWKANGCKYIRGLDGRVIYTRSEHSLLNALFQSAGAVVMKEAMIIADQDIREAVGDNAAGMIRYHDEEQWNSHPDYAEQVGELGVQSIVKAGIALGLRVPLNAEYMIGDNWAECH